jgi:excisionase family DNA binding protein
MATIRPEITGRASGEHQLVLRRRAPPYAKTRFRTLDDLEPLAVSPQQACRLLNVGITYLYGLINNNELESYLEGRRARKITMRSIRARQERQLAAARGAIVTTETAQPRRRGRPPKTIAHAVQP